MGEQLIPPDMIEAAGHWRSEGWALLDGLVPAEECEAALSEIAPWDTEVAVRSNSTRRADVDTRPRFRQAQFDGTVLFPYPDAPNLNRLFVHPAIIAFAQLALESDDLRLYQSRVWSKRGGHTNYAQAHHVDDNHSVLPIREGTAWGHIELFLYLHDTDAAHGAPRLVPRQVAGSNGWGLGEGLGGSGTTHKPAVEDVPHFYEHEIVAAGRAGTLFAYRSDVWHRGADIEPDLERHILTLSFRTAAAPWINFDAHGPLVTRPDFVAFVETCTPDELALFEVPRPGHEFWTVEVLDAMARTYPKLDLTPWRDQL